MAFDCSGRRARTLDDAECYIRRFINEMRGTVDGRVTEKNHEYDLYLPWLMEVVENVHVEEDGELLPGTTLERLYMEASWSLVQQGVLRPGPRKSSGENTRDGYGKGFSLTFRGEDWVKEAQPEEKRETAMGR